LLLRPPPITTLFPYTTLFRSRERVVRPLQTLSNMIAALREQDYSLRAREARSEDALGLALWEINALTSEMQNRRLGALEAGALRSEEHTSELQSRVDLVCRRL